MSANLTGPESARPLGLEPPGIRRAIACVLATLAFLWPQPGHAAPSVPSIAAPEAIVLDGWTGNVLYAKNADRPRDPASTVKIMTALVVLDRGLPLNRVVTVSPVATSYGGSTAQLYAGERMSVWNLLHGMLL